jgi:adenine-specific DNA-methyltransferase
MAKKYSPQNDAKWLSDNHDFIVCISKNKFKWAPTLLPRTEKQDERYQNPDNDPRGPWKPSGLDVRTYTPEYDYEIVTPSGRKVRPPKGRCWRCSKERFEELVRDNRIWFGPDGNSVPSIKRFLSEVKQGITPLTIWTYKEVGHNQEGTQELKNIGYVYTSPKPVRLIERVCYIGGDEGSIILDFFAGSGTTAHAVMSLNKEDNGKRKFILIEMADYFDKVLVPRLKKMAFSFKWKDGKAQDSDGIGIFFKYYELEQYEDTLRKVKYEDSDLFDNPYQDPYSQYVFMKDLKMLSALEVDYENNKVKVDLSKLYPNIDIAETLSNLLGKWIKRITAEYVEFEDGEKIDLKNLDYKLIKPLIWW